MIARRIQTSRAKLDNPNKPIGVFMLCGPSGVGKTETALALAEALYGGEQNVITINMSEFQEAHTVSTLKGAPPGYVGYGEGGILTEAVRRKSVQRGVARRGRKGAPGRARNVLPGVRQGRHGRRRRPLHRLQEHLIILTSNVGTDLIMSMCNDPDLLPDPEPLANSLRPPLLKVFPAALIGRIVVIPYYPLSDVMLGDIVRLQLRRVQKRVAENYRIPLSFEDEVVKLIVSRCTEIESGGRMIDAILTNTVLPRISREYLEGIAASKELTGIAMASTTMISHINSITDIYFEFRKPLPGRASRIEPPGVMRLLNEGLAMQFCLSIPSGWFQCRKFHLLAALAMTSLCACLLGPKPVAPVPLSVTVQATAKINPDNYARPSPAKVVFYELKSSTAFETADFFSLAQKDQASLYTLPTCWARKNFSCVPARARP